MVTNYIEISSKNAIINKIEQLYVNSFPKDERRDFNLVKDILSTPDSHFKIIAALNDNIFLGFISYWEWCDMRYIEHFAIEPTLRGGGIGQDMIIYFAKMAQSPIILEVEPAINELAMRRIGFYKRCGYTLWNDVKYFQPPYDNSKESLELKIMTLGEIQIDENSEFITRIKKYVYGAR
ncbi:MAG: GNAT family N-acetyltransferase [Muribaculaceae bacterium]